MSEKFRVIKNTADKVWRNEDRKYKIKRNNSYSSLDVQSFRYKKYKKTKYSLNVRVISE